MKYEIARKSEGSDRIIRDAASSFGIIMSAKRLSQVTAWNRVPVWYEITTKKKHEMSKSGKPKTALLNGRMELHPRFQT